MTKTKIITCTCKSEYQDKEYGKGKRVANHASSQGSKEWQWRCTVCGKEKMVS